MSHRIIFGEFEYANYLEWNWLSFISLRMATVFVVEEETETKTKKTNGTSFMQRGNCFMIICLFAWLVGGSKNSNTEPYKASEWVDNWCAKCERTNLWIEIKDRPKKQSIDNLVGVKET